MFGMGDEMFGKWETKCSAFRRTKVRRKSPAAYQEAQIKKNIFLGHSREPIEPIEILFCSPKRRTFCLPLTEHFISHSETL